VHLLGGAGEVQGVGQGNDVTQAAQIHGVASGALNEYPLCIGRIEMPLLGSSP
jgi:hypothetical protein